MAEGMGWRAFRITPWLVFLAVLFLNLKSVYSNYGGLAFVDDASYAQCQFARQIQQGLPPGLSEDQPSPMTRRGLYTLLLTGVYALTGNMLVSVYLVGAVIGCLILLVLYRLAEVLGLTGWGLFLALFLVILHPIFLQAAITANGDGLFILLITLSFYQYWSQTKRGRLGLSLTGLIPLALAASVHLEAVTVLIWMGCAACLIQILRHRDYANAAAAMIFTLTGALTAFLVLAPAVFYHLRAFSLPWPRYADAAITIDLSGVEIGSLSSGVSVVDSLFNYGALMMPWPGMLTLLAVPASLGLIVLRRSDLPFEWLSLLILPSILANLLIPITGREGLPALTASLALPLVLLAFLLCSQTLELAQKRFGMPDNRWKGWSLPIVAASVFFLIIALQGLGLSFKLRANVLQKVQNQRARVIQAVKGSRGPVVSDRPGWLAWSQEEKVIDLLGHYSFDVLASLNASRKVRYESWDHIVKQQGIQSWVIWSKEAADELRASGVVNLPSSDSGPGIRIQGRSVAL